MKYALGNMLNGAGGLNADQLSLDLQFALDKTLTARKGPTPTFLRASAATQVNAAGLIEYAPENLVLQSENFGTSWNNNTGNSLVLNDALSPVNTLTADRVDFPATATTGLIKQIQQNFAGAFAGSAVVSASVWLKTVSGTATVYLTLLDGGTPWIRSATACSVTDQWQRFSVSLSNPALSLFISIGPDTRTTSGTPAQPPVQNAASVHIWGAQLERFSTARAYIPTTTAAVYGARFDHDPLTLARKGLLIEESRTNLYQRSENFADAFWIKTRSSIQSDAATAPDGTTTADKLIEDTTASNTHALGSTVTPPATPHTLSVFAKKGERNWIVLRFGGVNDFFNLNTGQVTTNVNSPTITNYGNGWYRCTITSSAGTQGSVLMSADGITTIYTGDGTSGIFLWGAQLEAGSFPTSYIPTTTAGLTRSADMCSITAGAFNGFYNQAEGTMIIHGDSAGASGSRWCATSPARAFELLGKTNLSYFESSGGSINSIGAITLPTKFGLACKLNDFQGVRNGVLGGADIIATMPSPTTLNIGNLLGASDWLNGCIISMRYYRKRLPNQKLQTLTT